VLLIPRSARGKNHEKFCGEKGKKSLRYFSHRVMGKICGKILWETRSMENVGKSPRGLWENEKKFPNSGKKISEVLSCSNFY